MNQKSTFSLFSCVVCQCLLYSSEYLFRLCLGAHKLQNALYIGSVSNFFFHGAALSSRFRLMFLIFTRSSIFDFQIDWSLFPPWYNERSFYESLVPDLPVSLDDLFRKSLLFFVDCDMIIDYPRATLPNEIILGGLTLRKPKQLPADFEKILRESQDGVILMSFGSSFPDLNNHIFVEVFNIIVLLFFLFYQIISIL